MRVGPAGPYALRMRALPTLGLLVLVLALCACGQDRVDGREVTFRGTLTAESMEPTLERGEKVVATEMGPDGPRSGDVIAFRDPGGWLGLDTDRGTLVHRAIGTPGDTITCCDAQGRIAVSGTALDEPYLSAEHGACNAPLLDTWSVRPGSALAGACRWRVGPVPEGMLFVLGDNREHAADSRAHLCPADEPDCGQEPWVPLDRVRGIVALP